MTTLLLGLAKYAFAEEEDFVCVVAAPLWTLGSAAGCPGGKLSKLASNKLYRRKLQKRLMHHRQQLLDLQQAKKHFTAQVCFDRLSSFFFVIYLSLNLFSFVFF